MSKTKQTGDLAEHIVALAALRRGWAVLLPFGDRHAYDVAIDTGEKIYRVQVKAAWTERRGTKVDFRKAVSHKLYEPSEVDFIVAVAIGPPDTCFIVPVEAGFASASITSLRLAPYREAWSQLGRARS